MNKNSFAKFPPMGWNSYDYYDTTVDENEVRANAIQKCGRPIVLSLSPGPALIDKSWHYAKYANMWRITDDLWDDWNMVKNMFYRCELWQDHVSEGCYPDCDMLPLGTIGKGFGNERVSRLTKEEQRTLMSLWCIFGSPLMLGGEMTKLDDWTLSLLTNQKVLNLLDPACRSRQICLDDNKAVWVAENKQEHTRYAGLFNLSDEEQNVSVSFDELTIDSSAVETIDLWAEENVRYSGPELSVVLPAHGCGLYQLS